MDFDTIESTTSKVGISIIARIMPGTDLIEGIETICRKHEIISGCIVSGIGSLKEASYVYIAPDPDTPNGVSYVAPQNVKGPLELVSLQGTIGLDEERDVSVHAHGMMLDPESRACGGHLVSSGNPVLITAEIMIHSTPDVPIIKTFDPKAGFELLNLK